MGKELISIIVPVFNVSKYLDKCIESLINQTYKNIEIILVDDGSTDDSGMKCDNFSNVDNRIIVIHKKNGGLSDARNVGIKNATGKYISFVDSDDYVSSNYIYDLYSLLKEYNTDISFCSYNLIYDKYKTLEINNNSQEVLSKIDAIKKILYSDSFEVSAWGKLFKIELFNDIEYPVGRLFEDVDTIYRVLDKVEFISVTYNTDYHYLRRSASITNRSFSDRHMYLVNATENMCNYLSKYPELSKAIKRRKNFAYFSTINRALKSNDKTIVKEKKKLRKKILKNMDVIFDKNSSFRDKIAIILIFPGVKFYSVFWGIYKKITNR